MTTAPFDPSLKEKTMWKEVVHVRVRVRERLCVCARARAHKEECPERNHNLSHTILPATLLTVTRLLELPPHLIRSR